MLGPANVVRGDSKRSGRGSAAERLEQFGRARRHAVRAARANVDCAAVTVGRAGRAEIAPHTAVISIETPVGSKCGKIDVPVQFASVSASAVNVIVAQSIRRSVAESTTF